MHTFQVQYLNLIILLLSILFLFACKNKKDNSIITKNEKETFEKVDMENKITQENKDYSKILKTTGFKFPDNQRFKDEINNIFKLDIETIQDVIEYRLELNLLKGEETSGFYPTIHFKEKYINHDDIELGYVNKKDVNTDSLFLHYNNYLFYKNKASFLYLKQKDPYLLFQLVQDYGYYNQELLEYIFPLLDAEDNLEASFTLQIMFGRTGINGKWKLRSDLYRKYAEHNPHILLLDGFIKTIMENEQYEGNRYMDMSCVLNEEILNSIDRKEGVVSSLGLVDYVVNKYSDYKQAIKENDYYGMVRLKWYIEYIYLEEGEIP